MSRGLRAEIKAVGMRVALDMAAGRRREMRRQNKRVAIGIGLDQPGAADPRRCQRRDGPPRGALVAHRPGADRPQGLDRPQPGAGRRRGHADRHGHPGPLGARQGSTAIEAIEAGDAFGSRRSRTRGTRSTPGIRTMAATSSGHLDMRGAAGTALTASRGHRAGPPQIDDSVFLRLAAVRAVRTAGREWQNYLSLASFPKSLHKRAENQPCI